MLARLRFWPPFPNAASSRNQMTVLEGRAPSRPLALRTRPRRSVAFQTFWKHARKTRACSAIRDYFSATPRIALLPLRLHPGLQVSEPLNLGCSCLVCRESCRKLFKELPDRLTPRSGRTPPSTRLWQQEVRASGTLRRRQGPAAQYRHCKPVQSRRTPHLIGQGYHPVDGLLYCSAATARGPLAIRRLPSLCCNLLSDMRRGYYLAGHSFSRLWRVANERLF